MFMQGTEKRVRFVVAVVAVVWEVMLWPAKVRLLNLERLSWPVADAMCGSICTGNY